MDKLLEFGRKALFYVRVLSGYEERRIRAFRLQLRSVSGRFWLHVHVVSAQERKATLRRIPDQAILVEVRRMVEEMQTINKRLEETEVAIEEYFKPIDKEAELLMKMKLEGEEKTLKAMMKTMHQQASIEKLKQKRIRLYIRLI